MRLRLLSVFSPRKLSIPDSGLILKRPAMADFPQWLEVRTQSRGFLERWEPKWPRDDLTRMGFRRRLKVYNQQWHRGTGRTYVLCHRLSGEIYGGISLSRIIHGSSKSALLGYWMGANHAGKGHMKKAVKRILASAFDDLQLNRVEAACLPENLRSIYLLEKLGFTREGHARKFLEINGTWQDHTMFAILNSDDGINL